MRIRRETDGGGYFFGPLFLVLAVLLSGSALAGCLLTTSFADLAGGRADAGVRLYSIGGTVAGLEGASITMAENATDFVTLTRDGPFTFQNQLAAGSTYIVTALHASDGRTCIVQDGEGHVASADVTNIAVVCPSTRAELASLVLSQGVLSPAFSKDVVSYTAQVAPDVFAPDAFALAITATTASLAATITMDGTSVTSGRPSTVLGIHPGKNTLSIAVSASDGATRRVYTILVTVDAQEAYVKPSRVDPSISREFGTSVALSMDGSTLAVGAVGDASAARGINGDQTDDSVPFAGAVYVFRRTGTAWAQEAYVKASNPRASGLFGARVTLSSDGSTLAVGAPNESSAATGIDGKQADTSAAQSGAVYIFTRSGTTWTQQAYVKASNTASDAHFGGGLTLSSDGSTLIVGAPHEASGATGIGGDQYDTSAGGAGAAYVFRRTGATWAQVAYVKASNTRKGDGAQQGGGFGASIASSSDGSTFVVGAYNESSGASGIDGNQSDASALSAGAAYVFRRTGTIWAQEAYVKASNSRGASGFGGAVALSSDGSKLAVGATGDSSAATGVDGNQMDTSAPFAGAAYVFTRSGVTWAQSAYVKASNTRPQNSFGGAVALSSDGRRLVVGSENERSGAIGINGNQDDGGALLAGAAYTFVSTGNTWVQKAYVKPSNTRAGSGGSFGRPLALSADGTTLAVGAPTETSGATGINGNQNDASVMGAGAVYVFR